MLQRSMSEGRPFQTARTAALKQYKIKFSTLYESDSIPQPKPDHNLIQSLYLIGSVS